MEFEELNQLFIKMGFDEGISSLGYNSLKKESCEIKRKRKVLTYMNLQWILELLFTKQFTV